MPRHIDQLTALDYKRPAQLAGDGAACSWSARRRQACRSPTSSVVPAARSPSPWVSTCDCPVPTAGVTSTGGWTGSGNSTSATTRWTTSGAPAGMPRCNSSGTTAVATSTSTPCVPAVCRSWVASWRSGAPPAQCSGALANLVANADLKQARLLRRIDEFVNDHGLVDEVGPATDASPTLVGDPATELDLAGFSTVIWATGYRPTYSWLTADAIDRRGRVIHDGGVAAVPGLYLLGLPFLRRRRSNLIAGTGGRCRRSVRSPPRLPGSAGEEPRRAAGFVTRRTVTPV